MVTFASFVVLFWLPLILWWTVSPKHFPFLKHKQLKRLQILAINIATYLVFLTFLALVMRTQPPSKEMAPIDFVGFCASVGVLVWIVVLSFRRVTTATQPILPSHNIPLVSQATPTASGQNARALAQMSDQARKRLERKLEQRRSQSNPNKKAKKRKQAVTARIQATVKPTRPSRPRATPRPSNPNPTKPQHKEDFRLGDDNLCVMTYQKPNGERSVRPIIIRALNSNRYGDWVVQAIDIDDDGRVKSFRVDRIVKLEHNNQKWTKYDDILGIVRTFECLI